MINNNQIKVKVNIEAEYRNYKMNETNFKGHIFKNNATRPICKAVQVCKAIKIKGFVFKLLKNSRGLKAMIKYYAPLCLCVC